MNDGGPISMSIPLVNGGMVLVDSGDYLSVRLKRWKKGIHGYACLCGSNTRGKQVLMHRIILGLSNGQETHHLNGNRLDNRRCNLETMTPSKHQKEYHSHTVTARNVASRKYPIERTCLGCGVLFTVHPDHRGRNRFCSKLCGNKNRRNVINPR